MSPPGTFCLNRIYDLASFDDLVHGDQQLRRYNQTERFGRREIDQIFSSPSEIDHGALVARRSQSKLTGRRASYNDKFTLLAASDRLT